MRHILVRQHRWLRLLWRLHLIVLLCASTVSAPSSAQANGHAARASADLAAFVGHYHPNTTIELRGEQLWFVRPPFQSQLVAIGEGLYGFTDGWLAGTPLQFERNADGSTSIRLLSPAGTWYEFARSGTPYPNVDAALAAELERALDAIVANPAIPGVVLSVSLPGSGTWAGARGVADRDRGIPLTPSDSFRIASISKTFLAVVVLQLVQEGALSLDQNVDQWLPRLVPNGKRITIRQLLNHTSGLPDYLSDGFMSRALANPGRVWSPKALIADALRAKPTFAPGTSGRWRYSNTNYVLLGMIVEQATGRPLAHEIRGRILDPLGMQHTVFEPAETPASLMHSYVGRRDLTDVNLSLAWAVGSMSSTVEDLDRFARALAAGTLLGPDATRLMHAAVGTNGGLGRPKLSYGLGLMHDTLDAGRGADGMPRLPGLGQAYGHTGALIGSRTALWYLPESGITLAIGINSMRADPNKLLAPVLDLVLRHSGR